MNVKRDTIKQRLKHKEDLFLRHVFAMLAKMAKADLKVDAWEAHAAERAFDVFPRAAARRRFCVRVFNESKRARKSLFLLAYEFSSGLAGPEDCLAVYNLLWDIACSTGVLKGIHKSLLMGICKYLNLPNSYFDIFYRRRQNSFREWTTIDEQREAERRAREKQAQEEQRRTQERQAQEERQRRARERRAEKERQEQEEWRRRAGESGRSTEREGQSRYLAREYAILGCSPAADNDSVRRAYRNAAKKFHPDMLRAQGYTEQQIQEANKTMAKINSAWASIRCARGL